MTTATFGKQRIFGMQFITWRKVMRWFAILANTHITRLNTLNRTIRMIQILGSSKAWKNRDFKLFRLLA